MPDVRRQALTLTFRLKKGARVRVDLMKGRKVVRRVLPPHAQGGAHLHAAREPKGLKAGNYTLRLRATRGGRRRRSS